MLPATATYRRALPYPHKRVTEVRVLHDGTDVTPPEGIPLVAGSVEANLSYRVTRSARFSVAGPELFPSAVGDLLSPYVAVVQIRSGIVYPDGLEEKFPIFTGRVHTVSLTPDGSVEVECDDLAADVVAYRFETPENAEVGASMIAQIQHLILQAIPSAVFGSNDVIDAPMPLLTWDEDRGQALDDLASALAGRWYALGDGSFVVRRFPYEPGAPLLFLADGEPNDVGGGLVSTATRTITRIGTANSIGVVSERMEADQPPIRVTARDDNPGSPTFFGSSFGFVTQILKPQTPVDFPQAQELAVDQLQASTALTEQCSLGVVSDCSLEPGDTVSVEYRDQQSLQVIDRIVYPLGTRELMSLSTRATSNLEGSIGG